jgi:prepilin-type N-terminal cleavage/methylation domain-containing protein
MSMEKVLMIVRRRISGFTLAELLIALAVLGVIATFTIPKVLQSQQDSKFQAVFREDLSVLSQAFENYKIKNRVTASTGNLDLTPFINYVRVNTSGLQLDSDYYSTGPATCDGSSYICLLMHNGSVIMASNGDTFGGTATTNALFFEIDPDGKITESGSPYHGNGKLTDMMLYNTGRLKSYGTCDPGTTSSWWTPACPQPGADPTYVGW